LCLFTTVTLLNDKVYDDGIANKSFESRNGFDVIGQGMISDIFRDNADPLILRGNNEK